MNRFIFCFYDLSYTPEFLNSWVNLVNFLNLKKIKYLMSTGESCNAFYAKQSCLGASVLEGPDQKPFQGNIDYENFVFLSGDIVFTKEQFATLYNSMKVNDLEFISANIEGRNSIVKKVNDEMSHAKNVEFDMVIIKKGVFEKLKYPWFRPWTSKTPEEQGCVDIDICKKISRRLNIKLNINTKVNIKKKRVSYA